MDQAEDVGTALRTRGAVVHGTDLSSQQSLISAPASQCCGRDLHRNSPAPSLPPAAEIWDNSASRAWMASGTSVIPIFGCLMLRHSSHLHHECPPPKSGSDTTWSRGPLHWTSSEPQSLCGMGGHLCSCHPIFLPPHSPLTQPVARGMCKLSLWQSWGLSGFGRSSDLEVWPWRWGGAS